MFLFIKHLLIGFLMGIADLIPGISGGTVAYLTGIYPRLLLALRHFHKKKISFLAILITGMSLAIFSFCHVMEYIFSNSLWKTLFFSYCIGFLGASIYYAWPKGKIRALDVILVLFGIVAGYILTFFPESIMIQSQSFLVILVGICAISATLLPGISGSYILILCNLYYPTIEALSTPFTYEHILFLGKLGLGIFIGAVCFSRAILFCMNRFPHYVIFFFLSFVIGSIPKLFSFVSLDRFSLIFIFFGFFTFVLLKKIYRIVTPLIQGIA